MRHSGAFFPYRHLPPEGVIEKTLSAVGGAFRALGETLDHVGAIIQGPGAQKDSGELAARVDGLNQGQLQLIAAASSRMCPL
jgi:hypothetical protein